MRAPTPFTRKPLPVMAMRVTPETVEDAAKWCGGEVVRDEKPSEPSDVRISLLVPSLPSPFSVEATLNGGDYLVRGEDGRFACWAPAAFEAEWEPNNATTPRSGAMLDPHAGIAASQRPQHFPPAPITSGPESRR
jgi:hypothetical protein